jgi:hypothetical protein
MWSALVSTDKSARYACIHRMHPGFAQMRVNTRVGEVFK